MSVHDYPRVPAMNEPQLDAAQDFFHDHAGDLVTIAGTYSATVRVSVFKDDRLAAAADITPDGRVFEHVLTEAA